MRPRRVLKKLLLGGDFTKSVLPQSATMFVHGGSASSLNIDNVPRAAYT